MVEKGANNTAAFPWIFRSNPLLHWRFGGFITTVLLGMLIVWTIYGSTIDNLVQTWSYRKYYLINGPANLTTLNNHNVSLFISHRIPLNWTYSQPQRRNTSDFKRNLMLPPAAAPSPASFDSVSTDFKRNLTLPHVTAPSPATLDSISTGLEPNSKSDSAQPTRRSKKNNAESPATLDWISVELGPNYTSNLLAPYFMPGGEHCVDSRAVDIVIPGVDDDENKKLLELATGEIHVFVFHSLDDSGNARCVGGDYFETDLSGQSWKSRPPVKDLGNGTYTLKLQVNPDFAGDYTLTIILLFRHFEGLKFSSKRFAFDKQLRQIPINFYKTYAKLPKLPTCTKSDFNRDVWSGRWTRLAKNDHCKISDDGRYRCFKPDFPCRNPWCKGSLGLIESNGWVYSAHCSFKIFNGDSAWDCLKNRWMFFWGDSNHVDSIRNLLYFVLDVREEELQFVTRRFDKNFTNPRNPTQTVRITNIFNGHWNGSSNYLGIQSLQNEGFRDLLRSYFAGETVPDTMIMNSGLHDGVYWPNIRRFAGGAEYAASFWAEVLESVSNRGLKPPEFVYRTTVATGGYARALAFNPNKMEAFNGVILEKMRKAGIVSSVIDGFDLTFPWHFDNRCNDGVHYGRAPAKMKWRDGQIGHQYFVDLMLVHVWLNVLCTQ